MRQSSQTYAADTRVHTKPDDGATIQRINWSLAEFEKKWGVRPDRVDMTQDTLDDLARRCFVDYKDGDASEATFLGMRVIVVKKMSTPNQIRAWIEWRVDPVKGIVSV